MARVKVIFIYQNCSYSFHSTMKKSSTYSLKSRLWWRSKNQGCQLKITLSSRICLSVFWTTCFQVNQTSASHDINTTNNNPPSLRTNFSRPKKQPTLPQMWRWIKKEQRKSAEICKKIRKLVLKKMSKKHRFFKQGPKMTKNHLEGFWVNVWLRNIAQTINPPK